MYNSFQSIDTNDLILIAAVTQISDKGNTNIFRPKTFTITYYTDSFPHAAANGWNVISKWEDSNWSIIIWLYSEGSSYREISSIIAFYTMGM